MTKLCLCMIVKNESKIIKECLNSVVDNIDYWVICDTGSTDGTQDVIKNFFEEKGISGELHEDKWVDFAHNRTLAFNRAKNKADYCFVIDADDRLIGNLVLPEGNYNCYRMKITLGNLDYYRQQIFKNDLDWKYVGVVHEYPCLVDLTIKENIGVLSYYVEDTWDRKNESKNAFHTMYGKTARFIDVDNVQAISKTINNLLLDNTIKVS